MARRNSVFYPLHLSRVNNTEQTQNRLISISLTTPFLTRLTSKTFPSYLETKPPDLDLCQASDCWGNINSGRYSTSPSTDNSDWTRGRSWSSSSETISCDLDKQTKIPNLKATTTNSFFLPTNSPMMDRGNVWEHIWKHWHEKATIGFACIFQTPVKMMTLFDIF